jgi:mannose-6-phosphate isomerase-like protein (cupin superfamily)
MKYLAALAALLAAALLLIAAEGPSATVIDHTQVAAALAKSGQLARTGDYLVSGAHRNGPGQVEVHENETDIVYVTDGEATFVTGGKMIGGKQTKAKQWLGSDIEGGETHHLSKGDVFVIPAGTPHWFKEVPQGVSYFLVKVIK